MSKVSKISVSLTPEMAELIHDAASGGDYASESDVIGEALSEWKLRRTLPLQEQEELRRLWMEGLASGPGRFADIDEIKQEGRRQLADLSGTTGP